MFPAFKIKTMNDFLSYNNIGSYVSTLHESSLRRVNDMGKMCFNSLS